MRSTIHTPGCRGIELPLFYARDDNRRIGSATFAYLQCSSCRLIRLRDVPENLGDYYPADYYVAPSRQELERLAASDWSKLATVNRFVQSGRLLEVGPAHGTFAFLASKAGFDVDAIEMDERCCQYLRDVVGVRAIRSDTPATAMHELGSYDVIALWHVIEHLPDPWALLREAAQHLAPGGVLVLAAPNPDSWQFSVMGRRWPHLDAPRHLYLLPRAVLAAFLAPLRLALVHETTRDQDARGWNRFGWQRLLMNRMRGRVLARLAFLAGYAVSFAFAPMERREPQGSAYTLVFQKSA